MEMIPLPIIKDTHMPAPRPIADRKAAAAALIEKARAQLARLEQKEAARLGKLAVRAGLADVTASDAELEAALKEVVARFRAGVKVADDKPAKIAPADREKAVAGSGD